MPEELARPWRQESTSGPRCSRHSSRKRGALRRGRLLKPTSPAFGRGGRNQLQQVVLEDFLDQHPANTWTDERAGGLQPLENSWSRWAIRCAFPQIYRASKLVTILSCPTGHRGKGALANAAQQIRNLPTAMRREFRRNRRGKYHHGPRDWHDHDEKRPTSWARPTAPGKIFRAALTSILSKSRVVLADAESPSTPANASERFFSARSFWPPRQRL